MRKVTGLALIAWVCALTACGSENRGPSGEPKTASTEGALRPGTTYSGSGDDVTKSPIKHVIVIIGENRTFDHVFATYKPKSGQHVDNLLSKGIINEDGTPGPSFNLSAQYTAIDANPAVAIPPLSQPPASTYQVAPGGKTPYAKLPPAGLGGPKTSTVPDIATAEAAENGLPDLPGGAPDPAWYVLLTTGGTGIAGSHIPDPRIPNASDLPNGPFALTPGIPYDAFAASPVHRFYQMWQQLDCSGSYSTASNPSGCLSDLFPWVETTVGAGSNTKPQPAGFGELSTGEGSTAMGFYNVAEGDAPYFKLWADTYAMNDNFHQSVQGGTGANHIMFGSGDAMYYSDGNGTAMTPPAGEIENPDPQPGTNNYYTDDGYGSSMTTADGGMAPLGGGSYSNCSDSDQPGVASLLGYLASLPYEANPRCAPGHYYLLNNYAPGYLGDGTRVDLANPNNAFTLPPSSVPTIGDPLRSNDVSFAYFGDQFDKYLADPNLYDTLPNQYCDICNFFQYSSTIMENPAARQAHLKDTIDFYSGVAKGHLPAVSFVKPSGLLDGHPASSKLNLLEGFTKKIVDLVQSQPALWQDTVIFLTMDEGGGYYDSGYVQALDFFGDGTRIPLIAISPHATGGRISHEYADHVSILKFIERNWGLKTVSKRSRDNLPNPVQDGPNAYAPTNSPAIGDLFDLFDFSHRH
jgi:phospholipase C